MNIVLIWVESVFTVLYLGGLWWLTTAMARQQARLVPPARRFAPIFIWAFGLLALGDTMHLSARMLMYALGDLQMTVDVLGRTLAPVSLGTLATAITMTFFYALMLVIWSRRFEKPYGRLGYLLFAAAAVRLALLAFPQNAWNSAETPRDWAIYRNLPLILQGLGVAYLILRDAIAARDRGFIWVGALIVASFTCYIPVILFADRAPALGMLMLPKTMAYGAMAAVAYIHWFAAAKRAPVPTAAGK